jgi:hypothetical protein
VRWLRFGLRVSLLILSAKSAERMGHHRVWLIRKGWTSPHPHVWPMWKRWASPPNVKKNQLYFTAGPQNGLNGLFGVIAFK